jgi:hypothetical protein
MKLIVIVCVVVILLSMLSKFNILPKNIYTLLVIIVMVIGLIMLIYKIFYAVSRDKMNYQEINFIPPYNTSYSVGDLSGNNPWSIGGLGLGLGVCIGQQCCEDGFTYVPEPTNMCLSNSQLPAGVTPYTPAFSYTSSDILSSVT